LTDKRRQRDQDPVDDSTRAVAPSEDSSADAATRIASSARADQDEQTRIQPSHAPDLDEARMGDQDATRIAAPSRTQVQDEATRRTRPASDQIADDATRVVGASAPAIDDETRVHAGSGSSIGPAAFATAPSPATQTGATAETLRELDVGSILRQRFRIEGVLGEGGMGQVFLATDMLKQEAGDAEVHVALKVIKPGVGDTSATFVSLQREARRAQQLAHPNIVTVYDFDRADGHIYMTMENLRGSPLSDLLKANRHGLDPDQARDIITQVASGLAYAHEEGIVHVDLKPQNVFVLENGRAKILDFGIAKAWQDQAGAGQDSFFGYSPPYASPELIAGKPPTPRDDVYALAIVAYALFTGKHPFDWKPADQAREAGMRPKHDAAFRRSEWNAIVRGLSFDADARPADAREFLKRFAPSRIKRAAAAVSIGSVVAALAFVMLFQPQAGPEIPFDQLDPTLRERLTTELQDAEAFAGLGDFDSAIQLYHSVLLAHPGNIQATEGINATVEQVLGRIAQLHSEGQLSNADVRASLKSLRDYEALPARALERIERLEANL